MGTVISLKERRDVSVMKQAEYAATRSGSPRYVAYTEECEWKTFLDQPAPELAHWKFEPDGSIYCHSPVRGFPTYCYEKVK